MIFTHKVQAVVDIKLSWLPVLISWNHFYFQEDFIILQNHKLELEFQCALVLADEHG